MIKKHIYLFVLLFSAIIISSCNLPQKNYEIIETIEPTDSESIENETKEVIEIDPAIIQAQDFAAKLLTGIAGETFSSPLSLQLSKVWYFGFLEGAHYFTYQFVEQGKNVYYCNPQGIWHLDDVNKYIDLVHGGYVIEKNSGSFNNSVFEKCTNIAMENGILLYADAI